MQYECVDDATIGYRTGLWEPRARAYFLCTWLLISDIYGTDLNALWKQEKRLILPQFNTLILNIEKETFFYYLNILNYKSLMIIFLLLSSYLSKSHLFGKIVENMHSKNISMNFFYRRNPKQMFQIFWKHLEIWII